MFTIVSTKSQLQLSLKQLTLQDIDISEASEDALVGTISRLNVIRLKNTILTGTQLDALISFLHSEIFREVNEYWQDRWNGILHIYYPILIEPVRLTYGVDFCETITINCFPRIKINLEEKDIDYFRQLDKHYYCIYCIETPCIYCNYSESDDDNHYYCDYCNYSKSDDEEDEYEYYCNCSKCDNK